MFKALLFRFWWWWHNWRFDRQRFRWAANPALTTPFLPPDTTLRSHKVDEARVMQEWFEAAEREGIDLSPVAMAERYMPEFNSDKAMRQGNNSPVWRDDVSVNSKERILELMHAKQF